MEVERPTQWSYVKGNENKRGEIASHLLRKKVFLISILINCKDTIHTMGASIETNRLGHAKEDYCAYPNEFVQSDIEKQRLHLTQQRCVAFFHVIQNYQFSGSSPKLQKEFATNKRTINMEIKRICCFIYIQKLCNSNQWIRYEFRMRKVKLDEFSGDLLRRKSLEHANKLGKFW